jgi:ribosomal-protein-alanine N-acetyltransferase
MPLPRLRRAAIPARALRDDLCLIGPRVCLRPLIPGDDAAMFAYASDPEVTRFLPWEPAPDVASVRPFLEEQVDKRRRGQALALAVVLRESGEMIGSTDLMDLRPGRTPGAELGYLMARPFWGQGLMTEAAGLTVAYALGGLGLKGVAAWADAENLGSRRVLEKIGMRARGSEVRVVKGERRLYVRHEIGQVRTR